MNDKPHVLIVEARFYEDILDALIEGAEKTLKKAGATFDRITVPGALEIPAAIRFAVKAQSEGKLARGYDGFVALGCVIRGETTHYETVCNESARGLMDLSLQYNLAIGNGILTVENDDQAWARAKVTDKDKGGGAAQACLDMIALQRHFALVG
ncbi:MAG: 6,7-dimethyl-8-ribityllumazine synthase [Rhodospirillaceae bacterium]|nr:MAG: 6,7-dimethyl-8-ribityllumazine synthase [Rhodospirillaceae bacterium]